MPSFKDLIQAFVGKFEKLDKILNGKATFTQSLPTCLWPSAFYKRMIEQDKINFGCHLYSKGLIFDTNGQLIPCNALRTLPDWKVWARF